MNLYEYLIKNKKKVSEMNRAGLIRHSILTDLEIYNYYLDAKKLSNPRTAVIAAANYFGISKFRVYKTRDRMERDMLF